MRDIKVTGTKTRSRYIRLTSSPFITVGDLLEFADTLRAEGIGPHERVDDHHAEDTRHLAGLSVRVIENLT